MICTVDNLEKKNRNFIRDLFIKQIIEKYKGFPVLGHF